MSRKRMLKIAELIRRGADKSNAGAKIMELFPLKGKRTNYKAASAVSLYLNGKNKY
jgi:hypothetical protein